MAGRGAKGTGGRGERPPQWRAGHANFLHQRRRYDGPWDNSSFAEACSVRSAIGSRPPLWISFAGGRPPGGRVPVELRVFLTAAVVVDDMVANAVIALFYSGAVDLYFLAISLTLSGLLVALN